VYGIVDELGGTISVNSALGEGTAFAVSVPVASEVSQGVAVDAAAMPLIEGAGSACSSSNDQPMLAAHCANVLRRNGYAVEEQTSSLDAADLAVREEFDLILPDVNMPDLSGWEVLSEILRHRPEQRVLMVSGLELTDGELARGIHGELTKPFGSSQLINSVAAALGKSGPTTDEDGDAPSEPATSDRCCEEPHVELGVLRE
jgi:CheY-like chemotaxis protein